MNKNTEIETLIRKMLANPKAWTKYEKVRHFIYRETHRPFQLHVKNSRIYVVALFYEKRDIETGFLWWKGIHSIPERRRVNYSVLGPDGYPISSGSLDDQDYFLVESLFERAALSMVKGEEWSTGPACEYCGSILSDGRCPSCGSGSHTSHTSKAFSR